MRAKKPYDDEDYMMRSVTKLQKSSYEKLFIKLNRDELPPQPASCKTEHGGGVLAYKLGKKSVKYFAKKYENDSKGARPLVYGEKISADFYAYLSRNIFLVPKTRLNVDAAAASAVAVCAKWIEDFKPFSLHPIEFDFTNSRFVVNNPFSVQPEKLEVKGFLRLLVIATFLRDPDVERQNAGLSQLTGEPTLVKIDPGEALCPAAILGPHSIFPPEEVDELPDMDAMREMPALRIEIANTVNDIANMTDEQIRYLIKGDNGDRQFNAIPFTDKFFSRTSMTLDEYQEKLIGRMIVRRNDMQKKYAEDLQWLKSEMPHALLPPISEPIPHARAVL